MADEVNLREFLEGFLVEADEHLGSAFRNLSAAAEASRRGEVHPRAVRELFRALHTLKGLSGMVGVEPIVALSHEMETVLRVADRTGGKLPPEGLDLLTLGLKAIESRVEQLSRGEPVQPAPESLLEKLAALQPETPALESSASGLGLPEAVAGRLSAVEKDQLALGLKHGRRVALATFFPSPELASKGLTITSVRERVGAVAEIVKVLPISVPVSPEAPGGLGFTLVLLTDASEAALAEACATRPEHVQVCSAEAEPSAGGLAPEELQVEPQSQRGFVRVEVSRLDEALEKLSEMVVNRFRLTRAVAELAATGADVRALQAILSENGRQLRDLRGAITRARMVRVAELLERIPLIVRGLARATGKQVRVTLDAGEAELDKSVGDRLLPALVHLVRNAVDHGLETPERRAELGKPPEGSLLVRSVQRANSQLELTIEDDGSGIDREQVASRSGRPPAASETELLEQIAIIGLSTRESPSHTSGRGVGMDIVRRVIEEELGGELAVRTEKGRGTAFTLRIPLSLTIVDAFTFECARQLFVVPVSAVEDIVEVEAAHVTSGPRPAGGVEVRILERRGEAMPLLSLPRYFGAEPATERRKALVVRRNGEPFAFEVDRMLTQQEVVVRPLTDPLTRVPGFAGSTDLGDGRPTLVLDLVAISSLFAGRNGGAQEAP